MKTLNRISYISTEVKRLVTSKETQKIITVIINKVIQDWKYSLRWQGTRWGKPEIFITNSLPARTDKEKIGSDIIKSGLEYFWYFPVTRHTMLYVRKFYEL